MLDILMINRLKIIRISIKHNKVHLQELNIKEISVMI
jgi:hypothetical protein